MAPRCLNEEQRMNLAATWRCMGSAIVVVAQYGMYVLMSLCFHLDGHSMLVPLFCNIVDKTLTWVDLDLFQ